MGSQHPEAIRLQRAIGHCVRGHRVALGILQKDMAERVGMSPYHLCMLENGHISFTVASIVNLAVELRKSPGEILDDALIPVYVG